MAATLSHQALPAMTPKESINLKNTL
jgi:hypothetical protein